MEGFISIVTGAALWKAVSAFLGADWFWRAITKYRDFQTDIAIIREEFDRNHQLFDILAVLEAEQDWHKNGSQGSPPFAERNDLEDGDLRNLPAFLEDVAKIYKPSIVSPFFSYDVFARAVVLCHYSKILWEDEPEPYANKYWNSFKRFAVLTERKVSRAKLDGLKPISVTWSRTPL